MLPGCDESLKDQDLEVLEHVAALATHHLKHSKAIIRLPTVIIKGVVNETLLRAIVEHILR